MMALIDITHTVKASAAPSEGARYVLDPTTGERFWVEEGTIPAPDPDVPPVPMPTKGRKKRGS